MVEINREHVQHIVRQNQSLADRVEALKQRLSSAMSATKSVMSSAGQRLAVTPTGHREHLVRTAEVNAAAFLGGLAQGKAGPDGGHFLHIPLEAWLGAGLEALGYFGVGGEQLAEHAINFGDGFLASWTSSVGFQVGTKWRTTGEMFGHGHSPAPFVAANGAAANGAAMNGAAVMGEISPQQMARIVAQVRGAAAMNGMGHS
jgi:hypothetical protein